MILNMDGTKPIYVQISEWLEGEILNGQFGPEQKIYSQYQLADIFTINPATAAKGLNRLVDEGILYKKRGLGMFVTTSAQALIRSKRKNQTLKQLMMELVAEAKYLNLSESELLALVKATITEMWGEGQ